MKSMNPVVWFEIYVNDMSRAQKFYQAVFDIKLSDLPMPDTLEANMHMMAFPSDNDMTGPGAAGVLIKMKGFEAGLGGTLVYFRSDDCSIEEKRIVKAGGKITQAKQSLGEYGFSTMAVDSEGNMFGIHSMA